MPSQFARFLTRSMDVLVKERRAAFDAVADALGDRTVKITVDGVAVSPRFSTAGFSLETPPDASDVELESNRTTILAVTNGRLTLEEAIQEDHIMLRGHLVDLVAFHDALVLYLEGAVRCGSFPALLEAYRGDPL